MTSLENAQSTIESAIKRMEINLQPAGLYDPVKYFMNMGGKRIRPALSLMAASIFTKDLKNCVSPALAIEVFHNFTLVHDDVMDEAHLRRGKETVHTKWDLNTAILSGDLMMIKAYQLLSEAPKEALGPVLVLFNKTAEEVCQGQQMDMDFEQMEQVSIEDYIEMIRLKTSVLLGCSLEIGALCAGSAPKEAEALYTFGEQLGIAFQIKDDLLDAFPENQSFGKTAGGDIQRKKKTYLYIKALELTDTPEELVKTYNSCEADKVEKVLQMFEACSIKEHAQKTMDEYFERAMKSLDSLDNSGLDISGLSQLGNIIMNRSH